MDNSPPSNSLPGSFPPQIGSKRTLNDFRVHQCQGFRNGNCPRHRPFTCFDYHFPGQRRRPSIQYPDGSFNYSPVIYCPEYQHVNGTCPTGDRCRYLHRAVGDVEQVYHVCLMGPRAGETFKMSDLKWLKTDTIITSFKVKPCWNVDTCKLNPCPYYHGHMDIRRSPATDVYYEAVACTVVRNRYEWLDPKNCPKGDGCQYCHTHNELAYHPTIYKTQMCKRMVQNGYCERRLYCPFAHFDGELRVIQPILPELPLIGHTPQPACLAHFPPPACSPWGHGSSSPRGTEVVHLQRKESVGHQLQQWQPAIPCNRHPMPPSEGRLPVFQNLVPTPRSYSCSGSSRSISRFTNSRASEVPCTPSPVDGHPTSTTTNQLRGSIGLDIDRIWASPQTNGIVLDLIFDNMSISEDRIDNNNGTSSGWDLEEWGVFLSSK